MKKLLVILGPTASGKSDLAIKIAKLHSGEVVSADSRQIYRGLNLGSGKVPKDNTDNKSTLYLSQGIPHHLLDIVSPKKYFSVAQYQKLAVKVITEIQKRGNLPILCGGSGLYISAVIEGWKFPKVKPNKYLRKKLNTLSSAELFNYLQKLDPNYAKIIDKNNSRRIIRAIEIALSQGKVKPLQRQPPPWDILILGLKKDKVELKERIEKRLQLRLRQGMIQEVKKLKQQGISSQRLEDFGLEYRWINRYLEGKINYEEMKQKLLQDILKFAKRQMTWFKKMKNIHWINSEKEAFKLVNDWIKN